MALNPQQMAQFQALLAQAAAQPTPHLSFKAGLIDLKGKTATADKRRGTVRLITQDGLLHLQWLTRPGDVVEVDLMLFKDAAVWEKVDECKDGRVYILKFKDSSARRLFWMQEVEEKKDEEIANKVRDLISSPPDESSNAQLMGAGAAGAGGRPPVLHESFATPPPSQPLPTPPIVTPSPLPIPTPAPDSNTSAASLQRMIQAALAASRNTSPSPTPPLDSAAIARQLNALAGQYRQREVRDIGLPAHSLTDILSVDRVLPLLSEEDRVRLSRFLPESDSEDLSIHMRSAQFAQTVQRMNGILNGENYGSLLSSLGLEIRNGGFGVEGLISAIERQVAKEKGTQGGNAGETK